VGSCQSGSGSHKHGRMSAEQEHEEQHVRGDGKGQRSPPTPLLADAAAIEQVRGLRHMDFRRMGRESVACGSRVT